MRSGFKAADPKLMETPGLTPLDWAIIVLYALSTLGLGYFFSRRQTSVREYFTGSGRMPPSLIGVSLFATLLSTISYLSIPGEAIGKGPVWMLNYLTLPIAVLVVGFIFIPRYMRTRVTSAYELLEERLGLGVRLLGATLFVLLRLVWMALLIYLAAKAMAVMFGLDDSWVPWITLVTGLVAITYTSMGGLRAVVITDLVQTVLMLGGALTVIGMVSYHFSGIDWMPTRWQGHWDEQPLFSFDPSVRVTIIGSMLSGLLWTVATACGDQTAVQRFMSTEDARAARRAYLTQQVVGVVIGCSLWLAGLALLGFFQSQPNTLPPGISIEEHADKVFPHFIAYHLPPGISGLVVAAMFAAAMSSLDSGVNSITAVITTDFFDRLGVSYADEHQHTRRAQLLAFSIGAIVVVTSSLMEHIPGNITAVTNKTSNLFTTPIFALFFFALFVPFARPAGVVAGTICGVTAAALIAFSGPIFGMLPNGNDPVSFIWISPAALLVDVAVGTIVSWILHKRAVRRRATLLSA